jgi:2-polyprenyl-6-methoxyphenol hydroxylase-like FAD-dependent oxidoreductase
MNLGVQEAVNLSFKLAAAVKGYSGPYLLQSYGIERRPAMTRGLEWSDRHVQEHVPWLTWSAESQGVINEDTPEAVALRKKLDEYITKSGPDCNSRGVEMDLRYRSSVIYPDRRYE